MGSLKMSESPQVSTKRKKKRKWDEGEILDLLEHQYAPVGYGYGESTKSPDDYDCYLPPSAFGQVFLSQLRIGVGYGKDADRTIDGFAMSTLSHNNFKRRAFEVKVSRSDFLHELKDPLKRRYAMHLSNEFYFVAPLDIIRVEEVPFACGLIEVAENRQDGEQLKTFWRPFQKGKHTYGWHWPERGMMARITIPAPYRDSGPPSWRFVAGVLRQYAWAQHRFHQIQRQMQENGNGKKETN